MDLGAVFPTTQIGTDPAVIRDVAQTAEGLGYRAMAGGFRGFMPASAMCSRVWKHATPCRPWPGTWNASTSSMTDHCATYRALSCAGS